MARIMIGNLPTDQKISKEEMRKVQGGITSGWTTVFGVNYEIPYWHYQAYRVLTANPSSSSSSTGGSGRTPSAKVQY